MELELLTDLGMHLFIERGMRGGISMVGKRYAMANNPLVKGYNPAEPTNYITLRVGDELAFAEERFSLEASRAHRRTDNEDEMERKERLDFGGVLGISYTPARRSQ